MEKKTKDFVYVPKMYGRKLRRCWLFDGFLKLPFTVPHPPKLRFFIARRAPVASRQSMRVHGDSPVFSHTTRPESLRSSSLWVGNAGTLAVRFHDPVTGSNEAVKSRGRRPRENGSNVQKRNKRMRINLNKSRLAFNGRDTYVRHPRGNVAPRFA